MNEDQNANNIKDKEYLEFIAKRLKNTNFRAKEKLQKIDELAEIIYHAKADYKNKKKA